MTRPSTRGAQAAHPSHRALWSWRRWAVGVAAVGLLAVAVLAERPLLGESIHSFTHLRYLPLFWAVVAEIGSMISLAEFGEPSMLIGGSNPRYPKTLVYAAAHADSPLIFFHLWNGGRPEADTYSYSPEHPQPVLLAARCGGARFVDGFFFTPIGSARRAEYASRLE
jgi:hypothetical protein